MQNREIWFPVTKVAERARGEAVVGTYSCATAFMLGVRNVMIRHRYMVGNHELIHSTVRSH